MEHEIHWQDCGVWYVWQHYVSDLFAADVLRGLRLSRPERHWRVITYY